MGDNLCPWRHRPVRAARGSWIAWVCVCAALAVTAGCSSCGSSKQEADAGAPALAVVAGGPLDALDAPPEVIAFGGSDAPRQAAAAIARALGQKLDLAGALSERYGPAIEGLDLDQPLRFAVSASGEGVLIAGMKSREAFDAALPAGLAETSFSVGGRAVHFGFVGDRVVLAERAGVLEEHGAFLSKLAGATVKTDALVVLSVKEALSRHRKALEALRQGEGLRAILAWAEDVARVAVSAEADRETLRLAMVVKPVAGSSLARSLARLKERTPGLLGRLPADAALAVSMSVDPERTAELFGRDAAAWLLQTALAPGDADHAQALGDFWRATSGELALSVSLPRAAEPGRERAALALLVGLRDAAAARDAARRARRIYGSAEVAQAYASMGLRPSFLPNAYLLGATPVDVVSAREIPVGAGPEQVLGRRAELFVELFGSHAAFDDGLGLVAFGAPARAVLTSMYAASKKPVEALAPELDRALARGAPGLFLLAHARAPQLAAILEEPKAARGEASLSVGAKDGVLHVVAEAHSRALPILARGVEALRRGW